MTTIAGFLMFHSPVSMPYFRNRLLVMLLTGFLTVVASITTPNTQRAIALEQNLEISPPAVPTETIVVGRSPQHRYVVIIPVHSLPTSVPNSATVSPQFKLLQTIRAIAPQAFLSRHPLGNYIYVSGFDRFAPAQQKLGQIQPYAANARVVYFP
jgi:hypothetical protein